MRSKNRARRLAPNVQSRPSTGMSPLIIPVDGDNRFPQTQQTVEELTRALAKIFAPTDRTAAALKSVTVGEFAVLGARLESTETIRPSLDVVTRSMSDRTGRAFGKWMRFR